MIISFLEGCFVFLTLVMIAYLIRHYIFTISVLRQEKKGKDKPRPPTFKPSVTILVPAHNEERVIGRLLERVTELTYPKDKLQVIIINDASTDKTGEIAEEYKRRYPYIDVLHRKAGVGGKGKAAACNDGFSRYIDGRGFKAVSGGAEAENGRRCGERGRRYQAEDRRG